MHQNVLIACTYTLYYCMYIYTVLKYPLLVRLLYDLPIFALCKVGTEYPVDLFLNQVSLNGVAPW